MSEDDGPDRAPEPAGGDPPDMTRERARTERRDLDKERGEPLAGPRGGKRTLRRVGRPLGDWTTRPRILVTNDDGIESRGILALKQALDPIGEVTVVAPDSNQSAVGHQKTLMRPLRVRERILADGSTGFSVDGSPTDAVSLSFLGFFEERFDLVASGINYGANLGDDITYSGTVSAAMEGVINNCPSFAISQEYYEHVDFAPRGGRGRDRRPQHPRARAPARRAAQREHPRGHPRGMRGGGGDARRPADLPGPARPAARPPGHPVLLDRRAAAVRHQRPRHRLRRGRQSPDLRHADPPGPDGRRLLRQLRTWDWSLEKPG